MWFDVLLAPLQIAQALANPGGLPKLVNGVDFSYDISQDACVPISPDAQQWFTTLQMALTYVASLYGQGMGVTTPGVLSSAEVYTFRWIQTHVGPDPAWIDVIALATNAPVSVASTILVARGTAASTTAA